MAEEAARRRIRMNVEVEGDLPPVALDRVQVQQVLVNLIRNGMDAMDTVTGDRVLGIRVHRPGDEIQIDISDRGRGVEFPGEDVRALLHDKGTRHGHGAGDLPIDCRVSRRTAYGPRTTSHRGRRSASRCQLKGTPDHDV